jgi:hypothetical protein
MRVNPPDPESEPREMNTCLQMQRLVTIVRKGRFTRRGITVMNVIAEGLIKPEFSVEI